MAIELSVRPTHPVVTWDDFVARELPFSIALDGYLRSGPNFTYVPGQGPYQNFDHHHGVSRLETRATCGQVHLAIQMGLFDCFQVGGEPHAHIIVDDCDEDVCLAVFELQRWAVVQSVINPAFNRLVSVAEKLDVTAGLFPLSPHLDIMQELAWVMEPYREFRRSGRLDGRDPKAFTSVITDVGLRVEQHMAGKGQKLKLDTRYRELYRGDGWSAIEETGPYGRQGAYAKGLRAFIAVRRRQDGNLACSVGRASEYIVSFPVPELLEHYNTLEQSGGTWGGGTNIGGSPKATGTSITFDELCRTTDEFIVRHRQTKLAA